MSAPWKTISHGSYRAVIGDGHMLNVLRKSHDSWYWWIALESSRAGENLANGYEFTMRRAREACERKLAQLSQVSPKEAV